ncbi:MAG: VanZ family protein [Cytophagaceae bacterium]|jgi:VanZ family protein|nr:VanZ family protein [Cytophagaceae bacterium]
MKKFLRVYWPAILWGIFILIATLLPGKSIPSVSLFRFDKLIHAGIFGIFAWLCWRGWVHYSASPRHPIWWSIGGFTILWSIGIEGMQSLIPDRSMDLYDMIANTIGVLIAGIISYFIHVRK